MRRDYKARQLMTEFFDKLRIDRKLDEALRLMKDIDDPVIASRIKGVVALTFSEVPLDKLVLSEMLATLNPHPVETESRAKGSKKPEPEVHKS